MALIESRSENRQKLFNTCLSHAFQFDRRGTKCHQKTYPPGWSVNDRHRHGHALVARRRRRDSIPARYEEAPIVAVDAGSDVVADERRRLGSSGDFDANDGAVDGQPRGIVRDKTWAQNREKIFAIKINFFASGKTNHFALTQPVMTALYLLFPYEPRRGN